MSNNTSRLEKKLPSGGQRQTHGGYSFLVHGRLPEHRAYIRQYLTNCRQGIIDDLGGEANLSTAQAILIDRIIGKLGAVRCMEEHTRENSVMLGSELAPALKASYLAYSNSIRLDLVALGIEKRTIDDGRSVQDVIREFDQDKKKKVEHKPFDARASDYKDKNK